MSKITLGGDRIGSGNRMKQELHNYFRSNHNLGCARISSIAPGVLYPMYTNIGLTGDTFDVDCNAFLRTLPTEGPMFGSFKLQVDVYTADLRLYQAILHNNTTEIGLDMDKVLLPKIKLQTKAKWIFNEESQRYEWKQQVSKSSLMYYLGLAGLGKHHNDSDKGEVVRKLNATPMLAYYDIFKNYYSNKQEENAYVIAGQKENYKHIFGDIEDGFYENTQNMQIDILEEYDPYIRFDIPYNSTEYIQFFGKNMWTYIDQNNPKKTLELEVVDNPNAPTGFIANYLGDDLRLVFYKTTTPPQLDENGFVHLRLKKTPVRVKDNETSTIKLNEFPLKNIDKMRKRLLTSWDLGEEIVIDENEELMPYSTLTQRITEGNAAGESVNTYPMQGLVVKCYQSDIFNNWLDSEWVAKVTEYSKVNVVNGSFTMDALNLAKKMYNHYNRVAITGGTYDDWQLAAYGEENYGKSEKPVYHGGLSSEVVFDEVVSTSKVADEPLGSLGGRGTLKSDRGGHVIIKCREACVIMVIASLTPRLTYTQGNSWYLTELDSIDDLHKPEFDRIGFQDLIGERMAWWTTTINQNNGQVYRTSIGKQPAWIEYQTDIDKCYGDFAEENGKGFMVLQRLYDYDEETRGLADGTAYIDPSKYNYPFAVNSLTAQNFWLFLNLDIKARRKMSAKQIPNF